jgi:drug/metabolite transporter (DMT)-like permease
MSASSPLPLPSMRPRDVTVASDLPERPSVRPRVDPRLVLALGAVWLIWGSTYLAMRVAVAGLPPFLMAGTRFVLAGAALLVIVRARGETMPGVRAWLIAVPVGALLFLCGNGLVVVAEQTLPSSVAAIVCATTPLIASALAAFRGERPRSAEIVGMVLGIAGVVLLGIGSPLAVAGWRALLVLLAPIGWAIGSLIARSESAKESGAARGLGAAGAHMVMGGVWMLLTSVVLGEHLPKEIAWQSAASWGYLVVFGSLVGFSAYSWLLAHSRPAVAMSYAYVNPVIAVVLGAALGGEQLGWATLGATALIGGGVMASVVLGRKSKARPNRSAVESKR